MARREFQIVAKKITTRIRFAIDTVTKWVCKLYFTLCSVHALRRTSPAMRRGPRMRALCQLWRDISKTVGAYQTVLVVDVVPYLLHRSMHDVHTLTRALTL